MTTEQGTSGSTAPSMQRAADSSARVLLRALRAPELRIKITAWLGTGVVVALLPLLVSALLTLYAAGNPTLNGLLARGDLLLVAGAVSGTAISELLPVASDLFRVTRNFLVVLATLVLVASTAWYGVALSFATGPEGAAGSGLTTTGSLITSISALVVGASSIVFASAR